MGIGIDLTTRKQSKSKNSKTKIEQTAKKLVNFRPYKARTSS